MSTGYVSRLESGDRQPTERAAVYLAERLRVPVSAFDEPHRAPAHNSLAQALAVTVSAGADEPVEALEPILLRAGDEDAVLRWQAQWLLADLKKRRGDREAERAHVRELVALGDEIGLVDLRVRALTRLARCLRSAGETAEATDRAALAHDLVVRHGLTGKDATSALLVLISAEADAGRLQEAGAKVAELLALAREETEALRAEALWTAAAVRTRQGSHTAARSLLEQALGCVESRVDLLLWVRLRLAAASLYLQLSPPDVSDARRRLDEANNAIELVGTPVLLQELHALRAHLAFHEGRFADARDLLDHLATEELRLTYRDRVSLDMLRSQLRIVDGQPQDGFDQLQRLAREAQDAANMDVAAGIWRVIAETLASVHAGK